MSPDGRWIAYNSDETGRYEVFVRPFPEVEGGKWQVSAQGGVAPLWAYSGRELFYRNANGDLVAAQVETDPSFRVVERRALFAIPSGMSVDEAGYISGLYDTSPGTTSVFCSRGRSWTRLRSGPPPAHRGRSS